MPLGSASRDDNLGNHVEIDAHMRLQQSIIAMRPVLGLVQPPFLLSCDQIFAGNELVQKPDEIVVISRPSRIGRGRDFHVPSVLVKMHILINGQYRDRRFSLAVVTFRSHDRKRSQNGVLTRDQAKPGCNSFAFRLRFDDFALLDRTSPRIMATKISEYELKGALQYISQASSSPTLVAEADAATTALVPLLHDLIAPLV